MNHGIKRFNREFAPHEGLVKTVEKPLRDEICLNGFWQFKPVSETADLSGYQLKSPGLPGDEDWEETPLKVPSPWNVNGFSRGGGGDFRSFPSYPDSWKDVKAGWLKRNVPVPADWSGSRIVLHFEAVAGYSKVFVNGALAGDYFDPFLPFGFDVTEQAVPGEELEILVWVAHGSLFHDKGKYGYRQYVAGSFWGSFIAGIWQDVYLHKMPGLYVTDTFVKPMVDRESLELEVTVSNATERDQVFSLEGVIQKWINGSGEGIVETPEVRWTLGDKILSLSHGEVTLDAGGEQTYNLSVPVKGALDLWSPGNPALYGLTVSVVRNGKTVDNKYTRFGWRQFTIKGRKFLLNGKTFRIKGDSWHFTGVNQMSRRYAYGWYRMLKEANGNGIRLHAQVFPRFYLELADEMGICILDESAIWHSDSGAKIDSEAYWEACRHHVRGMVLRDRNNPSVFGWSVCNETVEVAKMVFHAPKKLVDKNISEIREWVAITRENDPTRQWISGDGEIFGKTGLPTLIEHYTWKIIYPLYSLVNKPWGTGETGMAYFGSPLQVSKVNGHRAFESQLGRMEGLAGEAFDLIKAQRKARSSYSSVFNLIWYALKPLALGLSDITNAPGLKDGIFFGDYVEGKPGYQPERLGPYSSTVNPGYDSDLPLYETWPLFDGVKAAFSDDYKKRKNIWKRKTDSTVRIGRSERKKGVVLLAESKSNRLKGLFENAGLRFDNLSPMDKQLILIDGTSPPVMTSGEVDLLRSAVKQGSSLFFWNADESSKELIRSLSGCPVDFYKREASSYLIRVSHPLVRKESNKSFYFSELSDAPLSKKTIGGKWADQSNLILEACNTDWKKWNYQGEEVKTAKVYRSEREAKPSGKVIVQRDFGQGEIILSTLDLFALSSLAGPKVAAMMKNLGAPLRGRIRKIPRALNRGNVLTKALWLNPEGEERIAKSRGGFITAGPETRSFSFWLYSLRSLDDLLIEPGIPRMDMKIVSDGPVSRTLNGRDIDCEGIPLEKGWNKIVIKASSPFRLTVSCTQRKFLKTLKSYVYK